ncbi:hypothetical protein MSVAZ_3151 [Methanosarcina vacuolata Z-761]|uniref:Calcineurin-like phosphoesterase domain-containing protein n=1 Tax=Methanosarcina vacuolata Z-761 TaxID=1434123 RepID=A0A0E3Q710_9EURY|nr:hypothetical protein MSVAZ_3151 [Methanosarcina vacuolata Z-761]
METDPTQGVRSCCAPSMNTRTISLRNLISGLKIIHISDLHFTSSAHTLNSRNDKPIYVDSQNSKVRSDTIASFIIENRSRFGTNKVVITGDLTDSGDDADYKIAQTFVQRLKDAGFEVYAVPGNHDYCKEGNIVANTAVNEGLKAIFCPLCPSLPSPLLPFGCCVHTIFGSLAPRGAKCPIDVFLADNASKEERRQRFINYITHYNQYPHVVDFDSGRLILLDSMQGELDEITTDIFAQGKLGDAQLSELNHFIDEYQEQRKVGKKIIVCLHHSPFATDSKICLKDSSKFLKIICDKIDCRDKIDCLLFGHTTPDNVFQRPWLQDSEFEGYEKNNKTPLINCENLECVSEGSPYPITVLDLGSLRRLVYRTDGSEPKRSWGNPS